MRKAIKIICIALCAAVLMGLGLYFIPWSNPINLKMQAVVVRDGEVYPGNEIKVTGSIKEYLFKSTQMNVDISLGDIEIENNNKIEVEHSWRKGKTSPRPYYMTSYHCSSEELNRFAFGHFGLSHDLDWLVLRDPRDKDRYIVASTDPDFDPQKILEAFHEVYYTD